MEQLLENQSNIVSNATPETEKQNTLQHGLIKADGMMIQASCNHLEPLPVDQIRTANLEIESMQQQGLLMISAVKRSGTRPKYDYNGNIYDNEFFVEETGEYIALFAEKPNDQQIIALEIAIKPPNRTGIHKAIEHLAQLKPIGSSEVKQATVISYLVYDLYDEGISEYVVYEVCKEYRRSTSSRFFPDNAEFLKRAKTLMNKYKKAYLSATNGNDEIISNNYIEYKEEKTNHYKPWDQHTDEEKQEQIKYLKTLKPPYDRIYQRAIGIPDDVYDEVFCDPIGVEGG